MKVQDVLDQLEDLRAELDLSQEQMARKLDVSLRTYTKWLKDTEPSAQNLLNIIELLEEEGENNE